MSQRRIVIYLAILFVIICAGFLISRFLILTPNIVIPVDNTDINPPIISTVEFNKTVTMNVGDKVAFTDTSSLQLKEISDSRCKPNVQCIWQGELSASFDFKSPDSKISLIEFNLGTVNNGSITLSGYKFTLESATEKSADIVVSKINTTSMGYIAGHVVIGPFCPVEKAGQPCPTPPEAYSSRQLVVYENDGVTIKQKSKIDAKGNYKVTLPPGNYYIQIDPAGIGPSPKQIAIVKSFETSVVDFIIDTGIR